MVKTELYVHIISDLYTDYFQDSLVFLIAQGAWAHNKGEIMRACEKTKTMVHKSETFDLE